MKQAEILAAVRSKAVRHDPSDSVGGVRARVVPTEFLPASTRSVASAVKTTSWAEKLQRERDAERAATVKQAETKPEPEGEDSVTQPDDIAGDEGQGGHGVLKPRTNRRGSKSASS